MPGLKITRELHAEVRETLKENGIMTTAKIHNLSPQSVSRIKRGRSYIGYKRALSADHGEIERGESPDFLDTPVGEPKVTVRKPGLLQRLGLRG
jgi:hypothetical protein